VNLKKGEASLGAFTSDEILPRLRVEVEKVVAEKAKSKAAKK
jgi:hypothetical protein